MDLGSFLFSVISLLGAALCSNGDNISCPCPNIPSFDLTEPPPETCFQIDSLFRYTCIGGYLRKVGTSNLIKCKLVGGSPKWSTPTLECITDPKITTTQPPKSTVTTRHTDIPHDSTITTSVTAASLSTEKTQSISTAASVTTGRDRTEPTSTDLQAQTNHSQAGTVVTETKGTHQTTLTSTTTEPSSNGTSAELPTPVSTHGSTKAVIGCASLASVLALIGISLYCYKRKSRNIIPPEPVQEQLYMNVPSDPAS